MYKKTLKEKNVLFFSSSKRIEYGKQIIIISKPKSANGYLLVKILNPEFEEQEIKIEKTEYLENYYIVLSGEKGADSFYHHRAIPSKILDESSEKIEQNIIKTLSRSA